MISGPLWFEWMHLLRLRMLLRSRLGILRLTLIKVGVFFPSLMGEIDFPRLAVLWIFFFFVVAAASDGCIFAAAFLRF